MKIEKIQINGFGKLENKDIELTNGINIIIGKNESGKSTLLKFINSMLYGISKNKRGKEISDLEKYTPWNTEKYSGKIKYKLDNEKQFEIYRNFKNKELKIYNNFGEDITPLFNVEKNKEIPFFYEQTNVDEDLFLNSTEIIQNEIKIDKINQNLIIQKLSNLATTGNDNISYKKSIERLNKKQLEEIGTERSQDRPINKIINKINKLKNEKKELEEYEDKKYEIEKESNLIKNKIKELNIKLEFLNKLKKIKNIYLEEKNKININKEIIEEYNKKINYLEIEKEEINNSKNKNDNKKIKINKYIFTDIFLLIIFILINLYLKNNLFNLIYIFLLIPIIIYLYKNNKLKNNYKKELKEINYKLEKINNEINLLNENKNNKINELNNLEKEIENKIKKELIINNLNTNNYEQIIYNNEIEEKINITNKEINENKLEEHKLILDKENIFPKIDKLVNVQEELEYAINEYNELKNNSEIVDIAKEYLEKAYKNMKENITPKFSKQLSKTISKISDEKYKNIKITDNNIIVETENGNYVPISVLSEGTIQQLYFSLRMAILEEISKENLPIFLDESFVFFDKNRLMNTINYLNNNYKNQIIIFSCTEREKEILNKLNIKYNLINM